MPKEQNMKPTKTIVTPAQAAAWSAEAFLIQVKADGIFQTREIGGCVIAGEFVTGKSGGFLTASQGETLCQNGGEAFFVFDVLAINGTDTRPAPNRERWDFLTGLLFPDGVTLAETCLRGEIPPRAEGIVAKRWEDAYGPMECLKVLQTFECVVTRRLTGQSVEIADANTGQPRGKVALRGGKCDQVRRDSLVKIEGLGLTDRGIIREPRICKDTETSWLIQF